MNARILAVRAEHTKGADMFHNCKESPLTCFECKQKICRECLVVAPGSMLCKKCSPTKLAGVHCSQNVINRVTIHGASVLYSFIAFGILSMFAGCVQ